MADTLAGAKRADGGSEYLLSVVVLLALVAAAAGIERCAASEVQAVAVGFVEEPRLWGRKTWLVARLASGREVYVGWDGEQSVVPGERLVLVEYARGDPSIDRYVLQKVEISPELRLRSYPDVAAEPTSEPR